jgi:ABC-type tungstate transport system permease subunit
LRIAGETASYTLTDRATFTQNAGSVRLRILFEGGGGLINTYAVVLPSPRGEGLDFAQWLTNGRGKAVIDAYRIGGATAFTSWPATASRSDPAGLPYADARR